MLFLILVISLVFAFAGAPVAGLWLVLTYAGIPPIIAFFEIKFFHTRRDSLFVGRLVLALSDSPR